MFLLELHFYLAISEEEEKKALKQAKGKENSPLFFYEVTGYRDLDIPSDSGGTLITRDVADVKGIYDMGHPHVHVIYCGDSEAVKAYLGTTALLDIWPEKESPAVRTARLESIVERLNDKFGYWTYQSLLEATIDTSPDLIWFKRQDGIHTLVNDVFAATVNKTKEDIEGRDHFYIWDVTRDETQGANDCSESEEQVIAAGHMLTFEEPVKTRSGMKQLTTYKTPVYDWFGRIWGTLGFGHDVTDFSNMGIELSILVDSLPFPVVIFDTDWKVVRMNEEFKGILESNGDDDEDFSYLEWKEKRMIPVHMQEYSEERHAVMQEVSIEILGSPWTYIVTEQEIRDYFDNVSGYCCLFQDVTFQRTYEQTILNAANTDVLTGLFNRRYFYEYVNDHSREMMTLLYMDLDHFKAVNDTYGHAKGDEVLKKTASYIRIFFPDGIAARLGGDEYAVILVGRQNKTDLAERCGEMERAVRLIPCGGDLFVTVSIGLAETNGEEALSADEFIHLADQRMYDIKAEHHKDAL